MPYTLKNPIRCILLAGLCALLMPCDAYPGAGSDLSLAVEDAPNIIYEDSDITLSLCISNDGAESAKLTVRGSFRNAEGAQLWERELRADVAAGKMKRGQITYRPGDVLSEATSLKLLLLRGGRVVDEALVRLARPGTDLPGLHLQGSSFVDGEGVRVMFEVERRVRPPSTRWLFVRWARKKIYRDTVKASSVVFVGDRLCGGRSERRSYLDRLEKNVAGLSAVPVSAGGRDDAFARTVGRPERLGPLMAVAEVFSAEVPDAEMAVIFIGNHACEYGVDVLDYRRCTELIIQRLEHCGTEHFVIVPPVAQPSWRRHTGIYDKAVGKVCWHYKAKMIEIGGLLDDDVWRRPGDPSGVFLRDPTNDGHRVIADTIAGELAEIRRR